MTGNSFLIDTNIISALLKGEAGIADKLDKAKKIYIPIIVLGELYYGAAYSAHSRKNIKDIESITGRYEVLTIDERVTILYGAIKSNLRKKGRPIPENDIWIAAIAQRNDLIMVTRDKHFSEIDELKIRKW